MDVREQCLDALRRPGASAKEIGEAVMRVRRDEGHLLGDAEVLTAVMGALVKLFRMEKGDAVANWSVVQVAGMLPEGDALRDVMRHDMGLDAALLEACITSETQAALKGARNMVGQ